MLPASCLQKFCQRQWEKSVPSHIKHLPQTLWNKRTGSRTLLPFNFEAWLILVFENFRVLVSQIKQIVSFQHLCIRKWARSRYRSLSNRWLIAKVSCWCFISYPLLCLLFNTQVTVRNGPSYYRWQGVNAFMLSSKG